VVSFAHRPPYPPGKSPRYPLSMRLDGPRADMDDTEKRKMSSLPGLELRSLCRPARGQWLYRLSSPDSYFFMRLFNIIITRKYRSVKRFAPFRLSG
jgi:hypothetical protein